MLEAFGLGILATLAVIVDASVALVGRARVRPDDG
jgi:hypothetical protein